MEEQTNESVFDELLEARFRREVQSSSESISGYITLMYPQYSLEDVARMDDGDIELLYKTAKSHELHKSLMGLLTNIAARSKGGAKKLKDEIVKEIKKLR